MKCSGEEKTCVTCKKTKPAELFYAKGQFFDECCRCFVEKNKKWIVGERPSFELYPGGVKMCTRCHETKAIDQFYALGKYRQSHCKDCDKEICRDRYQKTHPKKIKDPECYCPTCHRKLRAKKNKSAKELFDIAAQWVKSNLQKPCKEG